MEKMFPLLISLCICLSPAGAAKEVNYDYDGIWYNELGSCMELNSTIYNTLTGVYVSPKASGQEPAKGRVVGQSKSDDDTFSFSVTWENKNYTSTTGWVGEYKINGKGEPVLYTTWLLVSATPSIEYLWENTLIGKDEFYRIPVVDNGCKKLLDNQIKSEL